VTALICRRVLIRPLSPQQFATAAVENYTRSHDRAMFNIWVAAKLFIFTLYYIGQILKNLTTPEPGFSL
jgi:hypothetical protein